MKYTATLIFALLFLFSNCDKPEITPAPGGSMGPGYIETIDFSSSANSISEIQDFDVENENLFFIYDNSIFRIDLSSGANTAELILEDTVDWPQALKVIGNNLYYQGDTWATSQDIKQVDLTAVSEGVQATHFIMGSSRSQLGKNSDKLYYLSSDGGLSPTNNFYELDQLATDQLIATDEFIHPANLRVIDEYLYFSSQKEIRRFDLNTPDEGSSIVYTVPDVSSGTSSNAGEIIGFDIKDNVVYFTQFDNNKLLSMDLDHPDESPTTLRVNNDEGVTGYGKIIISDQRLYVKRIVDKQLEVFEL